MYSTNSHFSLSHLSLLDLERSGVLYGLSPSHLSPFSPLLLRQRSRHSERNCSRSSSLIFIQRWRRWRILPQPGPPPRGPPPGLPRKPPNRIRQRISNPTACQKVSIPTPSTGGRMLFQSHMTRPPNTSTAAAIIKGIKKKKRRFIFEIL